MKQGGFSSTILPFIPSNRRKLHLFIIYFTILVQISYLTFLFFDVSISMILLIVIGFPLIFLLLSSVKNFFLFIIIYISFLPLQSYCNIYRGFPPLGVRLNYLYILFVIFLIYWIFSLILSKRKIVIGILGYTIIAYTCIAFFSFLLGLINSNKNVLSVGKNELVPQLMYLSYFVFLTTKLKYWSYRLFFDFILIVSVIIGSQFIYAFPRNSISSFARIPTINVHISLLVFPYVLGILYFTKSIKRKLFSLIALLPITFTVFVSLQRGLWLAIGVSFILSLFLFLGKKKLSFVKILTIFCVILLLFSTLFLSAIFILSRITSGDAILVILKRLLSFTDIKYLKVDASAFERIFEIKQVFLKLKGAQWIIGKGLGDLNYSKVRLTYQHFIDCSYAWVIWKMGIVGIISFLAMFGVFLQRGIYLLRKKMTNEDTIYVMAIFLNIVGLMIVALTNSCLVHYRFIIIWAVSMAIMETIYRKYKNENTVNMFK